MEKDLENKDHNSGKTIMPSKMQKIKLSILVVGSFYRKTWFMIAEQLKKRGYDIEFITSSFIISKEATKLGYKALNLNNYLRKYSKDYDESKFFAILKEMGNKNEDYFFTREKYIYGAKPQYVRKHAYIYYKFFDGYFQYSKPDFLLYNGDDTLNVIGEKQAIRYGVKTLHTNCVGLLNNTLNWDKSVYHNGWIKEKYLKEKMSKSERENAERYITTIIEKRPIMGLKVRPILSFKFAVKYLTLTYHYLSNKQCRHDYWNPWLRFKYWMMRIPNLKKTKKYYSYPQKEEKYIFFPLHVYNDAQTTFRAVEFFRQDKTAELIAKALPKGMKSYVKQHPHGTGLTPIEWIKKIAKLPNTRLIPPTLNSHDIIENSQAVITINSDVGWEAIMHRKPVIVLDKPFYSGKGLTVDVKKLEELKRYIKEALGKKITEEQVIKIVHAALKSHYPGSFFKPLTTDFNYDKENIQKIADSIEKEIILVKNAKE